LFSTKEEDLQENQYEVEEGHGIEEVRDGPV
jgi:hypothetical protein